MVCTTVTLSTQKAEAGESRVSESFIGALFLVPHLKIGDTDAQLDKLNAIGFTGPKCSRSQVVILNHQWQGDHSCHNEQCRQSGVHNGLTHNWQHKVISRVA